MTTQNVSYGTRSAVSCTLASLANGSNRQSASVDNTTTKAVDYMLSVKLTLGTSPTAGDIITVFVAPGDSTYLAAQASGTDSAYSAGEEALLYLAGTHVASGTTGQVANLVQPSLAALFGGTIPPKFSFIVENASGAALNSSGANHEIAVTPITYTNA